MRVVVVGGLNLDVSLWVPRLPRGDETPRADRMERFCAGKGANQAVAAARLGAEVSMVGTVGDDPAGAELLSALGGDGVDIDHVDRVGGTTGSAFPIITPDDVSIIVAPGANLATDEASVERAGERITAADVLILQCEVPAEASVRAATIARHAGVPVVFNPSPVNEGVIGALLPLTLVLVVNRSERPWTRPQGCRQ